MDIGHRVGNGEMRPGLKGSPDVRNNTSNSLEDVLLNETTETGKVSSVPQLGVECKWISSCPQRGTSSWLALWGGSWRHVRQRV